MKSPFLRSIELLKSQKQLDMLYGLNIIENGEWYFANSKLKYNNNTIIIDTEKLEIDSWSISIAISHEARALFKSGLEKLSRYSVKNKRTHTKISE